MDSFFLLLADLAFLVLSIVPFRLHWRKTKRVHWGFPVSACLLVAGLLVAWRFLAEIGFVT